MDIIPKRWILFFCAGGAVTVLMSAEEFFVCLVKLRTADLAFELEFGVF
jgi:hypothetical protein